MQCRSLRLLPRLEVIDPVQGAADDLGHCAPEVIVIELFGRWPLDGDRDACDPRAGNRANRSRKGFAPDLAVEVLPGAQPGEQYARGFESGHFSDQQCVACAAQEVPPGDQLLEPSSRGGIDGLRLFCELTILKNAQHEAIDSKRCQAAGPDLEMHQYSPQASLVRTANCFTLGRARRSARPC